MQTIVGIPDKYRVTCEFCQRPLDVRDHGNYQRTTGWVMNRSGGGGHGVSLPVREPRWAHGGCVEQKSKGTFAQATMF